MPFTPFKLFNSLPIEPRLAEIWRRFESLSFVGNQMPENLMLVDFFARRVEGDIVECGTWKGGMACAMMAAVGPSRDYHFFDSFEGLPPADGRDGQRALAYQADTASPDYFDNCRADFEAFHRLVHSQGIPAERIHIYKGWFKDTLPAFPADRRISVLRLDGDWYESTMDCLTGLWDRVSPGGIVIVDDYDPWDGCARAVHDFLSRRGLASRIYRTPVTYVPYIIKTD